MDVNTDKNDFDELEDLFGSENTEVKEFEKVVLSKDLEGFASCFPEWDLHPPVSGKGR